MSGFLDRILSGKYPKLESIWRTEFERLADEFFKLDLAEEDDLDTQFDESPFEAQFNAEIEALRADLSDEKARRESLERELRATKAELKSTRYRLDAVKSALDRAAWHGEPIG